MSKFNVRLDTPFQKGDLDEESFVDLPNMDQAQRKSLAKFIKKTTDGEPLPGKNKPSHLNDQLEKIPGTDNYENGNYWHYHCGPGYNSSSKFSMTFDLGLNINGSTSAEVIHYIKENVDTILIVGYSPKHVPFPSSDDGHNPLFGEEE